jgi:uncharacterized protein YbjT (DUF2867 family)
MRVLVIGGNGFIGRPVVRELKNAGYEVAVLRRSVDVAVGSDIVPIQGDRNRLQDYEAWACCSERNPANWSRCGSRKTRR